MDQSQSHEIVNFRSCEPATRNCHRRAMSELRRGDYFAGLFILGCANGFAPRVVHSVQELGWLHALFRTFDISVIVLASCFAGIWLILSDDRPGIHRCELMLGAGFVFLVILPIGPLSWFAVSALSLWILLTTETSTSRRGAIILLATTVPMLWSSNTFSVLRELHPSRRCLAG